MPPKEASSCDVALISMPWAPPVEPSLGLGILKSCLTRAGISTRIFHFGTELLRWVKHDTYQYLADAWGLNEFVFTAILDSTLDERQQTAVVNRVRRYWETGHRLDAYPSPESVLDLFMYMRYEIVPQFLEEAAEVILRSNARIVGFTCLFDQTMASLALATKLKSINPKLTIVFGGYALEGPPGSTVAQSFPCIDYLVQGDGEQVIVDLSHFILGSAKAPRLPVAIAPRRIIRAPNYNLNNSPTPDYDDWYENLMALEASHRIHIETQVLPVESSRGCWWGQNMHCVFCGIDDETLKYRYKKPSLTLQMLENLQARYGDVTFRFSDYIMPKVYYSELLPRMADHRPRFRLHSEIKANHPPERIRLLVDAGFVAVQPGIESFSTPVLRSMNKGVRGIDNVCLLKTGYREHLAIHYNILYGLPNDTVEAYEAMLEMLPRLYHLIPPVSRTETIVTRFAPLQMNPERFGISRKPVHHESYDSLFSAQFLENTGFSLDDYVYYFERNFAYAEELKLLYSQLVLQVDNWKKQHRTRFVELSYASSGGVLMITDSRYSSEERYALSYAASVLYERIDHHPVKFDLICTHLNADGKLSGEDCEAALAELEKRRLIWKEGDLVFGLAVPRSVADAYREAHWPQHWLSIYV